MKQRFFYLKKPALSGNPRFPGFFLVFSPGFEANPLFSLI
jgi:hypothetical protein